MVLHPPLTEFCTPRKEFAGGHEADDEKEWWKTVHEEAGAGEALRVRK
jgi:hypothetical protein